MEKEKYDASFKFNLSQKDSERFKSTSKQSGILASEVMRRLVKIYLIESEGKTPAQARKLISL